MTVLLLAGMCVSLWFSGGQAFSPGRLSAQKNTLAIMKIMTPYRSHADFESQCTLCHAPLKAEQHSLCAACHPNIEQQITDGKGTHSQIEGVNRCADCHPDHRGREFDTVSSAFALFDHSNTSFSLAKHMVNYNASPIECMECHEVENGFSTPEVNCETCHATNNQDFITQHTHNFGKSCLECHDGADRMTDLDHHSTGFPLDGEHLNVSCVECHQMDAASPQQATDVAMLYFGSNAADIRADPFKDTPRECAQCHQEPEAHRGFFQAACSECHTTSAWAPASLAGAPFDHAELTGFSLNRHAKDYQAQPLTYL